MIEDSFFQETSSISDDQSEVKNYCYNDNDPHGDDISLTEKVQFCMQSHYYI